MTDNDTPSNYILDDPCGGKASASKFVCRILVYAMKRLIVLLAFSIVSIMWIFVAVAGAFWASANIGDALGFIWFVLCAAAAGVFWGAVLRFMPN